MIEIRPYKETDGFGVNLLLKENSLSEQLFQSDDYEYYIVSDGDAICGLCGFKIKSKEGFIEFIFIVPQDRQMKLGDGLLRGVLNYMEHKGVSKVHVKSDGRTNGFYVSEGFQVDFTDPRDSEKLTFSVKLPDFFNKPCKGNSI